MKDNYIELKINRDFGDTISVYFDFFKQNFKNFTNIFIRYNGIFLIFFLIISYLMVTGIMGIFAYNTNLYTNTPTTGVGNNPFYFGLGIILFFIIFMIVAAINFSISSVYISLYEKNRGQAFDKKEVWKLSIDRLGSIVLFILILIPIFIVLFIANLILSFIPLIGFLIQYVLQFAVNAWIGISFMSMIYENKGVTDALGEGWKLVTNNFWKSLGVNFIMGILIFLLIFIVLVIPGVIIGIYTFHAVETNLVISESVFAKLVYTLGMCFLFITVTYSQCLSQFVNGVLYFNLHEKTYNTNLRSKIDSIGEDLT